MESAVPEPAGRSVRGSRIRPAGDRAVLIELGSPDRVRQAHAELTARPVDGITDLVPGATTLLVIAERAGTALATAADRARYGTGAPVTAEAPVEVRLTVRYDGTDLNEIAAGCGMSAGEVVRRHSSRTYTVAFLGLVPGFAYLTGVDPALRLPRRENPRTAVPAGAVAMASEFTGVYPRATPGGWHLLGTTTALLWDLERDPPALLVPGARVHFDPI